MHGEKCSDTHFVPKGMVTDCWCHKYVRTSIVREVRGAASKLVKARAEEEAYSNKTIFRSCSNSEGGGARESLRGVEDGM